MSTSTFTPSTAIRTHRLPVAVSLLSTATALVHLYLGVATTAMVVGGSAQVDEMGGATALSVFAGLFYLSFVGYVVLNAALYLPRWERYRRLARRGLIVWAAGNLVAYFALAQGHVDAFGAVDKAIEAALIVLLVIEGRRERTGH